MLLADRVVVLAKPDKGAPATVRDIVTIDLPLARRREQSGFREHVQRLEQHIGVAATPEETTS